MRIIDWFKIGVNASEHGAQVDAMNEFVHLFMAVLFVGWTAFIVVALFKFHRSRHPKADYLGVKSHASTHLEVGVVIIEAVLLLGFAFPFWRQRVLEWPTGPDVVHVRAVGYQFGWFFHYAGEDGQFGRVDTDLYAVHPVALDLQDPGRKTEHRGSGHSHRAGGPAVRDRCDVKGRHPQLAHRAHARRTGRDSRSGDSYVVSPLRRRALREPWEIICGQLCGAGHSQMKGFIEVISQEDWEKWLEERTPKPAEPARR